VLQYDRARCHLIPVADVSDVEADEIASAQLAVDAKVEQSKFADSALHL
jgi:hypothetical protein